MKDNVLTKVSLSISFNLSDAEIIEKVASMLPDTTLIYSYIVYSKFKEKVKTGWLIECSLSQSAKYNTLDCDTSLSEIAKIILDNRHSPKYVIGYRQPSIELMLTLFSPLMHKLALEQCDKWNELEYEDALSMCKLVMLKLYSKGYYIHKFLLQRSFENYVLMELRHDRGKPQTLSFEHVMHSSDIDGTITLGDMLPDHDAELKAEKKEEDEVFRLIFDEVKAMIIEFIGERQFEQLLRDYGNKHTTPWSRKKMQQIKDKFKKLGITWKSFDR